MKRSVFSEKYLIIPCDLLDLFKRSSFTLISLTCSKTNGNVVNKGKLESNIQVFVSVSDM